MNHNQIRNNNRAIIISLAFVALIQLRTEIRLLIDHFTLTSIVFALKSEPLPFMFLLFTPLLLKVNSK